MSASFFCKKTCKKFKICKKLLTCVICFSIILHASDGQVCLLRGIIKEIMNSEKYSRGRRGALLRV